MLSQKTRYALKALTLLTDYQREHDKPMSILELAEQGRLPQKFLEAILLELKNNGILQSKKGKGGGYFLGRPADGIMIGDVVRILEGPLALLPCVSQKFYKRCDNCISEETCGLHVLFKEVRDSTATILDSTSLEKICSVQDQLEKSKSHMYFI